MKNFNSTKTQFSLFLSFRFLARVSFFFLTVLLILSAGLLGEMPAQADSLDSARTHYYPEKRIKMQQESEVQTQMILRLLDADGDTAALVSDWSTLSTQVSPTLNSKTEFSIVQFYRTILSEGSKMLLEHQKYTPPIQFDPSKFSYEINAEIQLKNKMLCLNALEHAKDKNIITNQWYQYGSLFHILADLHAAYRDDFMNRKSYDVDRRTDAKTKLITALTSAVQSINPIILKQLGPIVDVKVVDGVVTKIYFAKIPSRALRNFVLQSGKNVLRDTEKVSMDLSMLVHFLTGEDDAFISMQNCLLSHLTHMSKTFETRIVELEKGLWDDFKDLIKYQVLRNPREGTEADYKEYQKDLKMYLDERSDKDIAFMKFVTGEINTTLAFLNTKLAGAKFANRSLKTLSLKDIRQLLSLFLVLQKSEFPVAEEIPLLSRITQDKAAISLQKNVNKNVNKSVNPVSNLKNSIAGEAEWVSFYENSKRLNETLFKLQSFLIEDKSRKDVQKMDLDLIRGGQI